MPTGAVSKVLGRMRSLRRALLAGGLGFAVSCLAACGGGAGLLSGDQANTLNNQLNRISGELAAGHCRAVQSAAQGLVEKVAALPSSVDSRLRQDLDLGATTVSQLAAKQCRPAKPATTPSATTSTPTTTSATTTSTAPTTTTHTTTTPTTTTSPTTPTTPTTTTGPSGGGGLGGGSGSGGSGGSGGGGGGGGGAGAGGGNANG